MMSNWYQTGYVDDEPKKDKQPRHWMERESEKEIVFLTDQPFTVWEHELTIGNTYGNTFTCIKYDPRNESKKCPLCERASRLWDEEKEKGLKSGSIRNKGTAGKVGMYTIIDVTGFVAKDGKEIKNLKRMLVAKKDHLNMFKTHTQRRGSLVGSKYIVNRSESQTSAKIGDDWEFQERIENLEKEFDGLVKDNDLSPYNYAEMLEPKSYEELEKIVAILDGDEVESTPVEEVTEANANTDEIKVDY